MRGLKSTVALTGVLAALAAYIFLVDAKRPAVPPKDTVFTVAPDDISTLTVSAAGGETTTLEQRDGSWFITDPIQADADANAPSSLTSSLSTLEIERVVDEAPADLASFGLDPARIEIAFTAQGGETQRLWLGDKTPTGTDLYARREGDPSVFLLSSFTENTFNRTLFDLRDKRILTRDRSTVDRIEVANGDSDLVFVKQDDTEWNIEQPLSARGDFGAIDGLLGTLASTQVQRFIAPDATDLAQYGLDRPIATVTLSGEGQHSTLTIGDQIEGTYYATDSDRSLIFTVGENLLGDIRKGLDAFRRKDIFEFRSFTATRLEFTRDDVTVTLEKTTDEDGTATWRTGAGTLLETSQAEDPLLKFSNLRASSFVAVAPDVLDSPTLTVTAVYDDGDTTEVVRFARSETDVYAVREDEPGASILTVTAYDEAVTALDALE